MEIADRSLNSFHSVAIVTEHCLSECELVENNICWHKAPTMHAANEGKAGTNKRCIAL